MFTVTFKALWLCSWRKFVFFTLFTHKYLSFQPLPDSPLHFNTQSPQGPQSPQSQRWTTKDQHYLFHFPLLTMIHSNKAHKQFYALQRFYPYKTLESGLWWCPFGSIVSQRKSPQRSQQTGKTSRAVSAGKEQEQQLLDTSKIFFSRGETTTAKLPAMLLFL